MEIFPAVLFPKIANSCATFFAHFANFDDHEENVLSEIERVLLLVPFQRHFTAFEGFYRKKAI